MTVLDRHLDWLTAVVLALATWRLARLVVADQWPGWYGLRGRILRRWPPGPGRLSELLVCPWCNSIWLGALLVGLWVLWPAQTAFAALVLAVSLVAGVGSDRA